MHSPPSGPETPKESLVVRPQKPMGVNHNLNPTPQDPLREKEINNDAQHGPPVEGDWWARAAATSPELRSAVLTL